MNDLKNVCVLQKIVYLFAFRINESILMEVIKNIIDHQGPVAIAASLGKVRTCVTLPWNKGLCHPTSTAVNLGAELLSKRAC